MMAALLVAFLPISNTSASAGSGIAELGASTYWPNVVAVSGTPIADLEIFGTDARPLEDSVVIASLWPKTEVRDAFKPGDTFAPVPIDRVNVVAGRATVHVDDDALLRGHTSANGDVRLQLDLFTPNGRTVLFTDARENAAGRWVANAQSMARPSDVDNPDLARFDLTQDGLSAIELPPDAYTVPLETRHHHPDPWGCSYWLADPNVTVTETIATLGATKGVKADVTYTDSAQTMSELGFMGPNGLWQISGQMTRSSTVEADYLQVVGSSTSWTNKEYRAGYIHRRYWAHCPKWVNGVYDGQYYTQRMTEPYKVASFPAIIDSRYPLPGCVQRHDLSGVASVSTTNKSGTIYVAAFSIAWGGATFKGGARSDYSVNTKIKFTRPTNVSYWYWCGDAYAPSDSYRVRAGR